MPGNDDLRAGFADLRSGLQNLDSSIKRVQLQRVITGANEEVEKVRQTETDQMKQMQAIKGIANNFAVQAMGMGVSPQEASQMANIFSPPPPDVKSPEQFISYGALTGNQKMIDFGEKQQQKQWEQEMKKARVSVEAAYVRGAQAGATAVTKASKLSDKQTEGLTKIDQAIAEGTALRQSYNPAYTGFFDQFKSSSLGKQAADPNAVAYQKKLARFGDVYRGMVTGAAAADAELARIENRLPKADESPSVFKANMDDYLTGLKKARALALKNLGRAGKNVSEFELGGSSGVHPNAGKIVEIPGKGMFKIADDGDTLEPL